MVKTYKNKILPYEATKDGGRWQYILWKIDSKNERMKFHHWTGVDYSHILEWKIVERYTVIDAELIENSSDREEVVEKDRISKCVDEIFEYQRWRPWDEPDYVSIRKIIEKNLPWQYLFTQYKFTPADFSKMIEEINFKNYFEVKNFLKKHNLLSSDE